jgi:CRISPR type III-B/RAMP module RAMP protein Cmr6
MPGGKIITFYSYKGGTGRSMAVANTAWILASAGKKVLAVDWDLEAPGLHRYFSPFLLDPELTSSEGLIEMVADAALQAVTPPSEGAAAPDLSEGDLARYTLSLDWTFANGGKLDFLPAGRQDETYSKRINSFEWGRFWERLGGSAFLEAVRRKMRAVYDYTLIDSRTGLADTAGICTMEMPGTLVICFTLNHQSIQGAAAVAKSVAAQRPGIEILPVPMRMDATVPRRRQEAMRKASVAFSGFPRGLTGRERDRYFEEISAPYYPYYSYEETLALFVEPPSTNTLTSAMLAIASRVTGASVERAREQPGRFLCDAADQAFSGGLADDRLRLRWETAKTLRAWEVADGEPDLLLSARMVEDLRRNPELLETLQGYEEFRGFWETSLKRIQKAIMQSPDAMYRDAGDDRQGKPQHVETGPKPPAADEPERFRQGPIDACRAALAKRRGKPAHAGLVLASCLTVAGDKGESKRQLLKEAILAARNSRDLYTKAFARWKLHTRGADKNLRVRGRLIVGLGTESVLETGITLHHTYGTPIIPGSALKGLASHYCDRVWGAANENQEFRRVVIEEREGKKHRRCGRHYETLFGSTDDAGHIRFHDAWILPESLAGANDRGLVMDVMTPHHTQYYMSQGAEAPTDFDDPNPVAFLSVAGEFRVAVCCDAAGGAGDRWAQRALDLLTEALDQWGVGGKTSSGYGRLHGA